jgi:hypothetical protein
VDAVGEGRRGVKRVARRAVASHGGDLSDQPDGRVALVRDRFAIDQSEGT